MVSECFLNDILDCFVPFSGIEWYFKLPLRVSLSLAEISLNGPMVCNSNQWCTIGFFCKGDRFFVEYSSNASRKGHSVHSGSPEKKMLSIPKIKIIFNHNECSYELPEYSWNTIPPRTQLKHKMKVTIFIQETFGTPYFPV